MGGYPLKYASYAESDPEIYDLIRYHITRRRLQIAKQRLLSSQLPVNFDVTNMLGDHFSRIPHYYDVTRRMGSEELEEKENEHIADWTNYLDQVGSGKYSRKSTHSRLRKTKRTMRKFN